eukprot:scaffold24764_cov60-Phaeocystis_antarctica.AAC.6
MARLWRDAMRWLAEYHRAAPCSPTHVGCVASQRYSKDLQMSPERKTCTLLAGAHGPHATLTLCSGLLSMCCEMILIFSLFSSRRLVAFLFLPTDRCWMVRTSPRMQPSSRAASRTPARVILSVEGEIARPCATDRQLVGVG